jgi:hypothetical protein
VAQSTKGCGNLGCNLPITYLTMPGTGEVLAATITSGGTASVYAPLTDLMGSTLALVNSSDSVAAQYTYDPFGNVTASGQNIPYPYQYAGMALDQTGLYFDGSSYYDPALGRRNGSCYADLGRQPGLGAPNGECCKPERGPLYLGATVLRGEHRPSPLIVHLRKIRPHPPNRLGPAGARCATARTWPDWSRREFC